MREGSLEPPKRHPLDWQTPEFYDEGLLLHELERVYDVCHGCRRCFNLCNAFPTLFDLVDESKTGELDAVDKKDFWKVVDQCYLCDMCFMTKCPYVPPHPLNIDFPHLMLRAKAVKYKKGETSFRDKLLSSTDAVGKLAIDPGGGADGEQGQPHSCHAQGDGRRAGRGEGSRAARIHQPAGSAATRVRAAISRLSMAATPPARLAIYATCYVNYNEPGIGDDLLAILEHNEIPAVAGGEGGLLRHAQAGAGRPRSGCSAEGRQHPAAGQAGRAEGYAILTPIPSCTLMFKQELPLMFPDDADVKRVAEAMFDPFEYLVAAPPRRAAEDRLQAASWARFPTTFPATCACRTSACARRRC